MDASNEFRFISSPTNVPGERSNGDLCHYENSPNLRNVPVCVTKNVKLRYVWDKAFKLFQSQKTVYRAMSGVVYNDMTPHDNYGTSVPGKRKGPGCGAEVQRSRSQTDLSMTTTTGRNQEDRVDMDMGTSHHKEKCWERFLTSGDEDNNGNQQQQSSSSSCPRSRDAGETDGNLGVADKRSHYNCGRLADCSRQGGGRKKNLIPFQSAQLRRSQSHKQQSRPCQASGHQEQRDKKSITTTISDYSEDLGTPDSSPGSRSRNIVSKEKLTGKGRDSPECDSGLDTWKSPPGSSGGSIVCTISSQNGIHHEDEGIKRERRRREVNDPNDVQEEKVVGMNTSVVQIKSDESLDPGGDQDVTSEEGDKVDTEYMSEVDLNSSEDEEGGSLSELKMRFLTSGPVVYNPLAVSLPYPDNELDSLDLTLFETRRRDSSKTLKDLEAMLRNNGGSIGNCECESDCHFYESVSLGSASSRRGIYSNHIPGTIHGDGGNNYCWSDAGSEFEFMGPPLDSQSTGGKPCKHREIPFGHSSRGQPPEVEWEPYFCVLNQLDQTFTSYRSEEMSIFPGTPTRPRSASNGFGGDGGLCPSEVVGIRLDGGPNSVKCLINNSKWGMNPVLEEEEETTTTSTTVGMSEGTRGTYPNSGDYSSTTSSNQRNSSPASTIQDTSYDKACGSERRSSAPLTPLLGRDTPSRFANFFSKRSFKSNPLKRTKSVTKLERKKVSSPENESNIFPSRLRTSRSHESLLTWTNHSVQNFVASGMMSTVDLTAGDVTVRPLHPSILGQDFAFQVTTQSSGPKYYSCSSMAERDAWVQALRIAIKPYTDEVRRLDNSLKLWILEGKGLATGKQSASKRYFCELYLDDTLYARTSSKSKGEMLFWGEHFEFAQLPNCIQIITVIFFREGDKKRKKDKNTCLGKVKIPVSTVNSRYLIEKWYQVTPESSPSSSKEKEKDSKDGPSIRIKCKFQTVDILPVRCYNPLLQYVKDEFGPVCESLENVLSVKAKEDLASAMVHVLHHENLAKEFIAELALQELLKSGDEKLTFRGNSIATKAMEAFLKLTGSEYLLSTLGSWVEDFQNSEDIFDCEIDPMKLGSGNSLAKNQQNLKNAVDTVWKSILNSQPNFPLELRDCFSHCREALKSAGRDELGDHLISASIFLRFLCPAILSPSLFNITNEYPTEKSARNLTLVAKVMQTLANFTRFQGKETYMEFLNEFVEKEADNMKNFLAQISSPLEENEWNDASKRRSNGESPKVDPRSVGGFIDLGKYLSILSALLSESVGKIAPKNERFKKLQELLETIHSLLKQPHNASNIAVFPFPHLTTPPPAGPPPAAPVGLPHPSNNNRSITPIIQNHQGGSHQYSSASSTPIYAVTNVNPKVQLMNAVGGVGLPMPLHLQIPQGSSAHVILHNQRSGSQASSGYQSQSPVLEGDKSKNSSPQMSSSGGTSSLEAEGNGGIPRAERKEGSKDNSGVRVVSPLSFSNPGFTNRKSGIQSVDDLSRVGLSEGANGGPKDDSDFKKRLTRSSSSSDYEFASTAITSTKAKSRSSKPGGKKGGKSNGGIHHNRLSRRSSAELLRKNHPYSSSSDEDSDSGLVNDKDMESPAPQLPPRRSHANKSSGQRYGPPRAMDNGPHGHGHGQKSLEEYEREMVELRRAMEALQVKLNRAEERLFGHEQSPRHGGSDGSQASSPLLTQYVQLSPNESLTNRNSQLDEKEMEQLLQRFLSAEEEMKREQELLLALDRKQKLIEAQEQKISRLDAVNNQLLSALSQIRDSLQQQHVQQQQMKIQQQLVKQQEHLQSLSSSLSIPGHGHNLAIPGHGHNYRSSTHLRATTNYLNNNLDGGEEEELLVRPERPSRLVPSPRHSLTASHSQIPRNNNNTTKILITSDHHQSTGDSSGSVSPDSLDNHHLPYNSNNRDSSTILGEQALQMLAELKSSSC